MVSRDAWTVVFVLCNCWVGSTHFLFATCEFFQNSQLCCLFVVFSQMLHSEFYSIQMLVRSLCFSTLQNLFKSEMKSELFNCLLSIGLWIQNRSQGGKRSATRGNKHKHRKNTTSKFSPQHTEQQLNSTPHRPLTTHKKEPITFPVNKLMYSGRLKAQLLQR